MRSTSHQAMAKRRGKGRNLVAGFSVLGLAVALAAGYAWSVVWLAGALRPASARYFAPPNFSLLLLVGFFPCLFVAFLLVNLIAALLVPSLRRGITWSRTLTIASALAAGVLLLGAVSGATAVASASDGGVSWRQLWEISGHHVAWSQVRGAELDTRIASGRGGPYVVPELWLDIGDGSRHNFWRTPTFPFEHSAGASLEAIAGLISAHQIPILRIAPAQKGLNSGELRTYNRVVEILTP